MNQEIIHITMEEADLYAVDYFIRICGFHREGEKYERLFARGMEIKEWIKNKVKIRAVVSSFDKEAIRGNTAFLDGVSFVCNGFEQLSPAHISALYVYILTAGSFELDEKAPVLDQLYADVWGTAYVDAGLEILKQRLTGNKAAESFGPGFYGMDIDQVSKFFRILDGEKIDVRLRNHCLMLPLKSCSGFLVAVDDVSKLPAADCKSCRSDHAGCEFCHARLKGETDNGLSGNIEKNRTGL